jgi:hypothetical protein
MDIQKIKEADTRNQQLICRSKSRAIIETSDKYTAYTNGNFRERERKNTAFRGVPSAYSLGYGLNSRS